MTGIKKTDTFFVISNFNTDPERYLPYCENYRSNYELAPHMGDGPSFREKLAQQERLNVRSVREKESFRGKATALPRRIKNRIN